MFHIFKQQEYDKVKNSEMRNQNVLLDYSFPFILQ